MSKKHKTRNNILLPGMEDFESQMMAENTNDPSLEAELLQLLGGSDVTSKTKQTNKKSKNSNVIDHNLLNFNIDDDDGDVGDLDENDPELLAELNDVLADGSSIEEASPKQSPTKSQSNSDTNFAQLKELQANYREALQQAQLANEPSKVKRFERALKTIDELLVKVGKGISINESDFPPKVPIKSIPASNPDPPKPSPPKKTAITPTVIQNKPSSNSHVLTALMQRQDEYKKAALDAKKSNNLELAKGLLICFKQFDEVIDLVKSGESFDLSEMPGPPSKFKLSDLPQDEETIEDKSPISTKQTSSLTFEEELKERLSFFKEAQQKAQAENNSSKARRMGRTIQQYEEAINAYKKGGQTQLSYNYSELTPPSGKPNLSLPNSTSNTKSPVVSTPVVNSSKPAISNQKILQINNTIALIKDRQAQFKNAALKAKKDNDLELAKELLRQSMGLEKMCQAAESGLPVDLSQMPNLPNDIGSDFEICDPPPEMTTIGDSSDPVKMINNLEKALINQIELCKKYEQDSQRAGDVLGARRFTELVTLTRKDLEGLKCLRGRAKPEVPRFHYEYRLLTVVRANPELGEQDLGVEIIHGQQLPLPDGFTAEQLDTYVVLTLPLPSAEAPQTFTSDTIKHTNNPQYSATTKFQINNKSRSILRLIRHKALKAEIYFKRGILKSDRVLGTAQMKLAGLEKNCTVHESCDLYEGRRLVAGKLEMKLKVRQPLGGGDNSQQIKEKWLVIDDFNKNAEKVAMQERITVAAAQSREEDLGSVDVLRYELQEMRKALASSNASVSSTVAATVRQRMREKELALQKQEERANSSNTSDRLAYLRYLSTLVPQMTKSAKEQLTSGNRDRAQGIVTRKAIVERELERRKQDNALAKK